MKSKRPKKTKAPRKPKKKTATQYRKLCVDWAKKQAKDRDEWKCQFCGRTGTGMQIHGSHILPEGAYPLMSAEPFNIITLCAEHHVGGINPYLNRTFESWHSHPHKFVKWFEEKWPGRYKELREMADEKKTHVVNWEARWNEINSPTD